MASDRSPRFGRAALLAATLAFALPGSALAQQEGPTPAQKETARNLMDVGQAKYREGDFAGALEAFEGADKIMGVTSTGLWRGKALNQLGRLVEARDKLLTVARIPQNPDESPVLTAARTEAAELQVDIAARIPEIELALNGLVAPAEPTITIDGNPIDKATLELPQKVDPGAHSIIATAPGHFELKVRIDIAEGEKQKVNLQFRTNGEPIVPPDPEPEDGTPITPPSEGLSPLALTAIIAGSVGAVGIIVGATTGGLSLAQASDAKANCVDDICPAADEGTRDSSVTMAHISTATFIIGGVGAAVAGVALGIELSGGDDETSDASLRPMIGPGWLGLSGTF